MWSSSPPSSSSAGRAAPGAVCQRMTRIRRDRGRRLEVGVRDRDGPADLRATATIPTTTPEETIGRMVAFFEREGPVDAIGIGCFGPVDRKPTLADLGTDHDDAEAGVGTYRRRPGDPPAPFGTGRLRHRRQRRRARRAPLGRSAGARHLLLHHGRHRDRRGRHGGRKTPTRPRAPGVRSHAHPARPGGGPFPGCLPVPRRLLGRARVGRVRSRLAGDSRAAELAGRRSLGARGHATSPLAWSA